MVLFPLKGRQYWLATDFFEKYRAIPVMVEKRQGLSAVSAVWRDSKGRPGYKESYASIRNLYKTQAEAQKRVDGMNRERDKGYEVKSCSGGV